MSEKTFRVTLKATNEGEQYIQGLKDSTKVKELLRLASQKIGANPSCLVLVYRGKPINPPNDKQCLEKILKDLEIVGGSILFYTHSSAPEETFCVSIKDMKGGTKVIRGLTDSTKVKELLRLASQKIQATDSSNLILVYRGKTINQPNNKQCLEQSLQDLDIMDGSTLYYVYRQLNFQR